ncbi:MAG: hypothetical protein AAB227_05015 [Pseudomonadota bacterium]
MPLSALEATLLSMLVVAIVGQSVFAVFETETPVLRKIVKWTIVATIAAGSSFMIGYWAALVPWALGILGALFHVAWCARNKIDPLQATPRRRYYELRGWRWPE